MNTAKISKLSFICIATCCTLFIGACVPDKGCSRANHAETQGDIEWLLSRDDGTDVCVEQSLGRIYISGRDGIPQNIDRGLGYLRSAADGGLVTAKWELALFLMDEERWKLSKAEALKYLTQAADDGYVPAQTLLGRMFLTGEHAPKDEEKGIAWLEKAAENGGLEARRVLDKRQQSEN